MRARSRSARDLQIDRPLAAHQAVLTDEAVVNVDELLWRHSRVDPEAAKAVLQAPHVAISLEEPAVDDAGDFVNAVTEDEAAVVDG